jgi:superfamily II DNA/RNA helicase
VTTFAALGVPDDLCDALDAHGIADAFDIQATTIAPALAGRDVSGRAPTGSGKTLAFGIPLVANVARAKPKHPRALVLVPTRELAAQVARDLVWLGAARGTRVQSFYGGVGFDKQIKALRRGVDIAVACPGRLADLVKQGIIHLDEVDRVVVDEADRMADMGFLPEVRRLLDATSSKRQTLLFSATLDGDVDVLVRRYQHDPIRSDVTPEDTGGNITHHHWLVERSDRVGVTAAIIERSGSTIVFSRTRHGADRITRQLARVGVRAVAIHGSRTQNQRDRALADFASGRAQTMVATDVAARGIHVDDVACVVHFDLPDDPKDYVHRSGRTGRAGTDGTVIALVGADQRKDARKLARVLDLDVDLVPAELAPIRPGERTPVAEPQRSSGPKRGARGSGKNNKGNGNGNKRGPQNRNGSQPTRSGGKNKSGRGGAASTRTGSNGSTRTASGADGQAQRARTERRGATAKPGGHKPRHHRGAKSSARSGR